MGSFLGGGSAKKAAKEQARINRAAARSNQLTLNAQAEGDAQQMAQAQAARASADYAEKLLGTPQETAEVNLAPDNTTTTDEGLLTQGRTVRQLYSKRKHASGVNLGA